MKVQIKPNVPILPFCFIRFCWMKGYMHNLHTCMEQEWTQIIMSFIYCVYNFLRHTISCPKILSSVFVWAADLGICHKGNWLLIKLVVPCDSVYLVFTCRGLGLLDLLMIVLLAKEFPTTDSSDIIIQQVLSRCSEIFTNIVSY